MKFTVDTLLFQSDVDIYGEILSENNIKYEVVNREDGLFDVVVFDEISLYKAKKII